MHSQERKMSMRKFVKISEIDGDGNSREVFTWNQASDTFQEHFDRSYLFSKIAKSLDAPLSVVLQEFERRKQILLGMVNNNLRDFRSVHKALYSSLNVDELTEESGDDDS